RRRAQTLTTAGCDDFTVLSQPLFCPMSNALALMLTLPARVCAGWSSGAPDATAQFASVVTSTSTVSEPAVNELNAQEMVTSAPLTHSARPNVCGATLMLAVPVVVCARAPPARDAAARAPASSARTGRGRSDSIMRLLRAS